MKKVGFFVPSLNHFIETLIYWLIQRDEIRVLIITSFESNPNDISEHTWSLERLKNASGAELVSLESEVQALDYLMFGFSMQSKQEIKTLNAWKKSARKTAFFSRSTFRQWKHCLKELYHAFPCYIGANIAVLEVSVQDASPYFFIKDRFYYTPFPHPQILWDEDLLKKIYSPIQITPGKRRFKFHFIGNYNPPERKMVLEQVKHKLNQIENVEFANQYPVSTISETAVNVLYIEYGHTGGRGIDPRDYIESLSQADFCISPQGWGDNWTHRTVEALLRGAIPILEDPGRYNIGLKDMQNCVVVRGKNWAEAIERAYQLDSETLVKMRHNVQQILEHYLLPERAASRLSYAMGI